MASRRQFIQQTVALTLMEAFSPFNKGSNLVAEALSSVAAGHPAGPWKFYQIAGQVLFPIYGQNGSLSTKQVCYLIRPKCLKRGRVAEGNWCGGDLGRGTSSVWDYEALAIGFNDLEFHAVGDDEEAVRKLVKAKLERATAMGKPVEVDLNGGSLPLPEEETWDVGPDRIPRRVDVPTR